ncbi:MAG: sodium-dependent transporter [Alloprevotella sp.]|nr:sodium-dependent transporter [Alloprevotella sp.]
MEKRSDFASKLGMVLATAGSAVGLGNIWRFPVEAGNNGGAAFIIIYLMCVVLLGIPLMVAEFAVGRAAHTNTARAYKLLSKSAFWQQTGRLGVLTGWVIMGYYVVVSGWTLAYFFKALLTPPTKAASIAQEPNYWADYFQWLSADAVVPVLCLIAFTLMSHFIITRGVEKGIERFSKIMMPMLFILLIVLCVCSFFTKGAAEGLTFLFKPDFSKVTFGTILAALGQAFFSLSIGMGCLCTYASYFTRETNLLGTAFKVAGIDTLVAIMAGIIIFPAVFSAGIHPDAGASLVFIALPGVFQEAFGGLPWLAYAVSVMFYFLLILATLTSLVSLHEVPTAFLAEDFHMSRRRATSVVTVTVILVGTLCSLSMGPLSGYTLFDKNIFDCFDWVSSQVLLVVGGGMITFFVGWKLDAFTLRNELTSDGLYSYRSRIWIVPLLRWFAPFVIMAIFLSGIDIL